MKTDDLVIGTAAAAKILGVSKGRVLQLAKRADNPLGAVLLPPGFRVNGLDAYYGFSRAALERRRIEAAGLRLRYGFR